MSYYITCGSVFQYSEILFGSLQVLLPQGRVRPSIARNRHMNILCLEMKDDLDLWLTSRKPAPPLTKNPPLSPKPIISAPIINSPKTARYPFQPHPDRFAYFTCNTSKSHQF